MKYEDWLGKISIVYDLYRKKLRSDSLRFKKHDWKRKHIGTYKTLQEVWTEVMKFAEGKLAYDVHYIGDVEVGHVRMKKGELRFITTSTQSWPNRDSRGHEYTDRIKFPTEWWIEVKFTE